MSAKVTLVGQPQSLTIKDGIVSFRLSTGPASNTSPKGLNLFKAATYVVQCSERQYNRGRVDARDKSELILEGYQVLRVDEQGQPYIAVVARSVASKNTQNVRKLELLREESIKAEEAFDQVCEQYGVDSPQAEAAGQTFKGVKAGLLKFMANHPELR